jgi:hypothetical protein
MTDLDQYEISALRVDNRIDACADGGHPYATTTIYEDDAKVVTCKNCGGCVEFVNLCTHEDPKDVTVFTDSVMCNRCHHDTEVAA